MTKHRVYNSKKETEKNIEMCEQVHQRNFQSQSRALRLKIPLVNLFTHYKILSFLQVSSFRYSTL